LPDIFYELKEFFKGKYNLILDSTSFGYVAYLHYYSKADCISKLITRFGNESVRDKKVEVLK